MYIKLEEIQYAIKSMMKSLINFLRAIKTAEMYTRYQEIALTLWKYNCKYFILTSDLLSNSKSPQKKLVWLSINFGII